MERIDMFENRKSTLGYGFMDIEYDNLENIIPSVVMGDGSVRVTTTYNPETNVTGISLCPAPINRGVGYLFVEDGVPKDPDEPINLINESAKFQVLFDNPKSIDVVIARLQEAKRRLLSIDYSDDSNDLVAETLKLQDED